MVDKKRKWTFIILVGSGPDAFWRLNKWQIM
jgi:hypothetical protein